MNWQNMAEWINEIIGIVKSSLMVCTIAWKHQNIFLIVNHRVILSSQKSISNMPQKSTDDDRKISIKYISDKKDDAYKSKQRIS